MYDLDMIDNANWDTYDDVPYAEDTCDSIEDDSFTKVAYRIELDDVTMWVEFDTMTTDACQLGVPVDWTFDQSITGLSVEMIADDDGEYSNLEREDANGYIEFWSNCYGQGADSDRDGSSSLYDFDDTISSADCYGSMQVHGESTTIFAFNSWSHGNSDEMGFGDRSTGNTDWTFAYVVVEAKRSLTHITRK